MDSTLQIVNLIIHNLWLAESEDSNPQMGGGHTMGLDDFGIICGSWNICGFWYHLWVPHGDTKERLDFQNSIFSRMMFLFCNVIYQLEMETPLLLTVCENQSRGVPTVAQRK